MKVVTTIQITDQNYMLEFSSTGKLKNNWDFTVHLKSRIYLINNWMHLVWWKFLVHTTILLHRSQSQKINKLNETKYLTLKWRVFFFFIVCRKYHINISYWAIPLFLWNVYESISFWNLSLWESTCQAWERYERQWYIRFLFLICYREFRNKKPNNKEWFRLFLFSKNENNLTSKANTWS